MSIVTFRGRRFDAENAWRLSPYPRLSSTEGGVRILHVVCTICLKKVTIESPTLTEEVEAKQSPVCRCAA